jgi:hypothetical protein
VGRVQAKREATGRRSASSSSVSTLFRTRKTTEMSQQENFLDPIAQEYQGGGYVTLGFTPMASARRHRSVVFLGKR